MKLILIVASSRDGVIGVGNTLPWHLGDDLRNFKKITTCHEGDTLNTVVMGRNTYNSIGRPLPGRNNKIVSHNADDVPEGTSVITLNDILGLEGNVFIIGGASLYRSVLEKYDIDELWYTEVDTIIGDKDHIVRLPEIDFSKYRLVGSNDFDKGERNDYGFKVFHYVRNSK